MRLRAAESRDLGVSDLERYAHYAVHFAPFPALSVLYHRMMSTKKRFSRQKGATNNIIMRIHGATNYLNPKILSSGQTGGSSFPLFMVVYEVLFSIPESIKLALIRMFFLTTDFFCLFFSHHM